MTENEAKQWLKHTRAYQHKCDNCEYIDIKGACNEECKDFYDIAIQALEEIQQYRAIGTIDEFKALKEKNEPKKAIGKRKYDEAYCPACNEVISDGEFLALDEYVHHCNYCGQAVKGIDWSE